MKTNADMITRILHNFRVNGRFNQDQLIIGRGQDEQLQLMIQEGNEGIGCLTFNGMTFYRRADLDQQLSVQCNTVYADSKDGTPTKALYCSNNLVWYGNNYYYAGSKIGDDIPTWEANGGTIDSPEGTVWGVYGGGDGKPYTSTFEMIDQTDPIGIRYTPGVTGERTFSSQITTPDTHPVWGTAVTLYPYPKPSNSYTDRTVLASSTMVWVSEPLPDFPTTVFAMMVTTDNTENVASAMAQKWSLRSLNYDETNQEVDWENSSETILVCGNDTITWSGDEASMYPSSPNDWNTTGSVGSQPVAFSMDATEGSDPKLEYTNDGSTWYEFGGQGSASLAYEPIEFTGSDLSSDGKITIQHDFNNKNVLCLGYTLQPKEIEYLDNQIVLDYSDQNSSNLSGAVWFVNSAQSMLVVPEAPEPRNLPENLTSNTSDSNWSLVRFVVNRDNPNEGIESEDPEMFHMFDHNESTGCTISGSAGALYRWNRSDLTPIKPEKLYIKQGDFLDLGVVADGMMLFVYASNTIVTSPYDTGSLTEIANHVGGAAGNIEIDLSSNNQSYIYWYVMMVNAESGTIYEISEDPFD